MEINVVTKNEFDELSKKVDYLINISTGKQKDSQLIFTNDDLCKALKVSKRTLQNYRDEGKIEFSQAGRKVYYTVSNIEDFMKKNQIKNFKPNENRN